jgi:hypothetical protein
MGKSNGTIKHHDRQQGGVKSPLRAKPGSFHKGKTGVKVNKPQKFAKEQRKRLSTSTIRSHHHDNHNV